MIAGVAAGLGDHLGVDVTIVRLVIVVLAVLTEGVGVLAYLVAAVLIPKADPVDPTAPDAPPAPAPGAPRTGRDPMFWVGVTLLVVGALWLLGGPFSGLSVLPGGRDLLWPLVLIGFGLALWRAGDRADQGTMPHAPQGTTRMTTDTVPMGTVAHGVTPTRDPAGGAPPPPIPPTGVPSGEPPHWTSPPEPPRPRSLLTRVTLGLALLTAGVLWLLRVTDVWVLYPGRIVAASLLVIGLGLLVAAFAGRARWLILAGGLLLPVVVVAEILHPYALDLPVAAMRQGAGEVVAVPDDLDEVRAGYQLGAGTILLDLTNVQFDRPANVRVRLGAGEVIVRLPEDVTAEVTADVAVGEIDLEGRSSSGAGLTRSRSIDRGEGSAVLHLDLQVGLGEIHLAPANP